MQLGLDISRFLLFESNGVVMSKSDKKVFLWGYQGLGNIGDDLMFLLMLDELRERSNISIYSLRRNYTIGGEQPLAGYKSIKGMMFADEMVVVGGNVFSNQRMMSYLKIAALWVLSFFRKLTGGHTAIESVGLDVEKTNKFWRWLVLSILRNSNRISLRDRLSYRYVRKHLGDSNLEYKYDRVYYRGGRLFDLFDLNLSSVKMRERCLWWISVVGRRKSDDSEMVVNRLLDEFPLKSCDLYFICQSDEDMAAAKRLADRMNIGDDKLFLYKFGDIREVLEFICSCGLIVTERFHGAILAEVFDKPWISVAFTEKLSRIEPNRFKRNEILPG